MTRKLWALALAAALPLGCSLTGLISDGDSPMIGPGGAFVPDRAAGMMAPRRNALKVAVAARPLDDETLGEDLWAAVDEQLIAPEARRALEANGLRVGLIDGALPLGLQEILDPDAPYGKRVDPAHYSLEDGQGSPLMLNDEPSGPVSLFLAGDGGAVGHDFDRARGALRVTTRAEEEGIEVRLVPEIHHGQHRHHYDVDEDAGPFEPLQLTYPNRQDRQRFRDLAVTVTLSPDQALVVGCWPGKVGSLGHFLLTEPDPEGDRLTRKVMLLWATPSTADRIPGVRPVAPPSHLRPVDPSELGLSLPFVGDARP